MDPHLQELLAEQELQYIGSLGSGGFGDVFLVYSTRYQEEFAVKRIKQGDASSYELDALIHLKHPNIVRVYRYFEDDTYFYIVLECCPGGSFQQLFNDKIRLTKDKLRRYFRDILLALKYCHDQGIAHRDIKPANILIDKYNRVKLADFGLARRFAKGDLCDGFVGSRLFAAPEILSARRWDPFVADVWSLGVTFYMMATGSYLWDETMPIQWAEQQMQMGAYDIPVDLDMDIAKFIKSALEYSPHFRSTVDQLLKLPLFTEVEGEEESPNGVFRESASVRVGEHGIKNMQLAKLVTDPSLYGRSKRMALNTHRESSSRAYEASAFIQPVLSRVIVGARPALRRPIVRSNNLVRGVNSASQ